MRLVRLAACAALLAGAVPLATASHARCAPQFATVCTTLSRVCAEARDLGVDPHCPMT